ncbi:pentapeptide repeat-containing protein [Streptomyces sp. MBT62]|uniref:pentapeptide repeat-containing protein n=1 Tax=Streptomyces sp. MBT62 TaxID=2800410 RepID=UPI00190E0B69|nr:pentapeptide repeat-containing protein [Streptomyces sp. MBT62]MBK3571425.1 pentapeptide repeat-containing protein [Streptomyces sp. MBT62]
MIATVVTGSTLAGLAYTIRHYLLALRGQVTDRYSRAVTQLAGTPVERLGGIYALEHVMRESDDDHETIVEVLASYVRTESPVRPGPMRSAVVGEDITAAMTVLARRPSRPEANRINLRRTDLTGLELVTGAGQRVPRLARADLCGARLIGVRMPRADLRDVLLGGADLTRAYLKDAVLSGAWLTGAILRETHLDRAKLVETKLDGAVLDHTCFQEADLTDCWLDGAEQDHAMFQGAALTRASLLDVHLEHSQGLTWDQIVSACPFPDGRTGLSEDFRTNPAVQARIAACHEAPPRHLPQWPFPWPLS